MKYTDQDKHAEIITLASDITDDIARAIPKKDISIETRALLQENIQHYIYHSLIKQLCQNPEAAKEAGIDPEALSCTTQLFLSSHGMGKHAISRTMQKIDTEVNDAFAPLLSKVKIKGHS